jgi:hypothetical protein
MDILESYIQTAPNPQNALDIFKGEWSSKLPGDAMQAGAVPLFEDPRIDWAASQFGGFENKTILELGPLEAGHTYMLEKADAASITAIEANSRAYLKCLVIKEVMQLKKSQFLYGDFVEFLKTNLIRFDTCIASGVLYHMKNPAELIALAAKASNQFFLWTHYYDAEVLADRSDFAQKFSPGISSEYEGFQHTLYRQDYGAALNWGGFCGGSAEYSHWMPRSDILDCCKFFGFNRIEINFEDPNHPNGPSFSVAASR